MTLLALGFLILLFSAPALAIDGRLWLGLRAIDEHTGHELESPIGEIGGEIYLSPPAAWRLAITAEHLSRPYHADVGGGVNTVGVRLYWQWGD